MYFHKVVDNKKTKSAFNNAKGVGFGKKPDVCQSVKPAPPPYLGCGLPVALGALLGDAVARVGELLGGVGSVVQPLPCEHQEPGVGDVHRLMRVNVDNTTNWHLRAPYFFQ